MLFVYSLHVRRLGLDFASQWPVVFRLDGSVPIVLANVGLVQDHFAGIRTQR